MYLYSVLFLYLICRNLKRHYYLNHIIFIICMLMLNKKWKEPIHLYRVLLWCLWCKLLFLLSSSSSSSSSSSPSLVLLHSRLQTPTGRVGRQKPEGHSREDSPVKKEKTFRKKRKQQMSLRDVIKRNHFIFMIFIYWS